MDHRFQLAPYHGKNSRLVCPSCGRREFSPYIDVTTGEILHETCGRCNRESNCGYHLTPSQYFQNHPEARPQGEPWRHYEPYSPRKNTIITAPKPKLSGPICELPKDIADKTVSFKHKSNFVRFLETLFDPLVVEGLISEYCLGVTKAGETIFYEIDGKGRFRGGKIIQYNPLTGHRIKNSDYPVRWVHTDFKRLGYIPQDWTLSQCLFGEHLLSRYPDKVVCVVEAEKTAVIGAGFEPDCVWVAVGGKTQLGDKLGVLRGRQIIVYPDVDVYDKWVDVFTQKSYLSAVVSGYLEETCTEEDREAQVDIADLLIRWRQNQLAVPSVPPMEGTEHLQPSFQSSNPVAMEVAKYFPAKYMPEIEALIEDFDLVPVSFASTKTPDNEDNNRQRPRP